MTDVQPLRVLVTGSAGTIGASACAALKARGHFVRGLDRRPSLPTRMHEQVLAELTDGAALHEAARGMDAVVHLAARPGDGNFLTDLLEPNVVGLHHVCEAARLGGARRLVLTSTCQVLMGGPWSGRLNRTDEPYAVANHYAATKVFLEALGQLYAYKHGLEVVVARPGFCPRGQREVKMIQDDATAKSIYLSHHDAGRFFTAAVEHPFTGYGVCYVASRPAEHRLDLEPGRRLLGYDPQDDFPEGLDPEILQPT